jgi:superfamily II DNA or RNA helicase
MAAVRITPKQREALRAVAEGKYYPALVKEEDGWYARWLALDGDNGWVDEYVRSFSMTALTEDAEQQRHETLHDAWMMALRSRTGAVVWDEGEMEQFAAELGEWSSNAPEDVAARKATVLRVEGTENSLIVRTSIPKGERALKALGRAMFVFRPLSGLRRQGDELVLEMSRGESELFARSGARELAEAKYTLEGAEFEAKVALEAELSGGSAARGDARIKLSVTVAGEKVGAEEIKFLLEQNSSFVFFRNRWIEVDRRLLKQALRALERSGQVHSSPLGFALGIGRIDELEIASVKAGGWIRGLVNSLSMSSETARSTARVEFSPPAGFAGKLADYQVRGVMWMEFLTENGFGALLADDMGLGKSVQSIAWFLRLKERDRASKMLVVAPLTLLSNWQHEFAKFAPGLEVYVHQGEMRHLGSGFAAAASRADVVVTSYGLLTRDYREISEFSWDAIVIDEAQSVKNPLTRAARALKALLPRRRIALTGTPVENSASDIWALEDFLNPGFLGDRKSFEEKFARPIAYNPDSAAARKLNRALEPFVLRRLKGDSAVAFELGPKREIREYCRLGRQERREYENALADFRAGERTRGDVFALISSLKQICDGEGKIERLLELVQSIFEAGESALVFTQYVSAGQRIQKALEEKFSRKFPFLNGSLSAAARQREIARFNRGGASVFILSLKAGGFGLNLTKATHVIHFDRWWNPAVENQATDRAHRIGQSKPVLVHLFITAGTIEERVDEILERKGRMAAQLVGAGENFIARLGEHEILDLVRLDGNGEFNTKGNME